MMQTQDGKWKPAKVTDIHHKAPRSYGTVQLQPHFYTRVHAWQHAVFRVCIT